jgi:hypothetical protein
LNPSSGVDWSHSQHAQVAKQQQQLQLVLQQQQQQQQNDVNGRSLEIDLGMWGIPGKCNCIEDYVGVTGVLVVARAEFVCKMYPVVRNERGTKSADTKSEQQQHIRGY